MKPYSKVFKKLDSFDKSKIYVIENRRKRKKRKESSVTEFLLAKQVHCVVSFIWVMKQL